MESSSGALFDLAAEQASALLFELSGRHYPGECGPKTVRPPCHGCSCGYQVLSRGYVVGPWNYDGGAYASLLRLLHGGLRPLAGEAVGLPGQGDLRGARSTGWSWTTACTRSARRRYVTRLDDGHWPYGQNLTLADTEEGTFSISYTYGADPPELGMAAAAQLGCEIYKACPGAESTGDCALPAGVTRVTRQGITIEKLAFTTWAFTGTVPRAGRAAGWNTGLPLVDAFLNTYNSSGLMRRPTFWAPGHRQYAQEVGMSVTLHEPALRALLETQEGPVGRYVERMAEAVVAAGAGAVR